MSAWPVKRERLPFDRFLTISKLFGLIPIGRNQLRISSIWLIYSIFPSITLCGGHLISTKALNTTDPTIRFIQMSQTGLQVLCIALHYSSFIVKRAEYNSLLEEVKGLSAEGERWYLALIGVAFSILYLSLNYSLSSEIKPIFYFYCIFSVWNEIFIFIILIQFCGFLDLIQIHIKQLGRQLFASNLSNIAEDHCAWVKTASRVNSAFSYQNLIICTLAFTNSTASMFYLMKGIKIGAASLADVTFRLSYCAWQISNVYIMVGSCEGIVEQVEDFNAELFRIMRKSRSLYNDGKLILYVNMKQSVEFTACGFFYLRYPLVMSIIAAATTYVVVLVQYTLPK